MENFNEWGKTFTDTLPAWLSAKCQRFPPKTRFVTSCAWIWSHSLAPWRPALDRPWSGLGLCVYKTRSFMWATRKKKNFHYVRGYWWTIASQQEDFGELAKNKPVLSSLMRPSRSSHLKIRQSQRKGGGCQERCSIVNYCASCIEFHQWHWPSTRIELHCYARDYENNADFNQILTP